MKQFILLFTFLTLCFGCKPKVLPTVMIIESNRAELKLSHQSTQDEMQQYAMDLERNLGIKFDYTGSRFFDDGRLRSLRFQVHGPKGRGGRADADLMNLQYGYVGFIFDLSSPKGAHIKTGKLE